MDDRPSSTSGQEIRCLHLASGDLWAGAEVQIYNLLVRLQRMDGIRPHAVLLNDGELAERLRAAGVQITVLDERRLSGWRIFRELVAIIRRERVGIVHTHRLKEHILGGVAARICGAISLRTVHGRSEHRIRRWDARRYMLRTADRMTARYLQRDIVAVSEVLGDELRGTFPRRKVTVIPNGIDLATATDLATRPESVALQDRAMDIAVVGRLVPVKRIDLVIDIARTLSLQAPGKFRFVIYGDGPLREILEARVRDELPEGMLVFRGFSTNLLSELNRHDALLIASDHEGLPTNLLEALALGKPVIARCVGEIPLVLGDAFAELCINGDCPATFAAKLIDLRERLIAGAFSPESLRARAELYDADVCAERHRQIYEARKNG
ncbi:glycosyltransferase [Aquisalimonas lutea]|uniref:glycosyltransferase n=1 Tax=Aquisalimonas lutea TaxID=1327750 RepID=UPI0025B59FCB|nr:glycosyltransferase [Aquisalimonas lutea]MDN3517204.1 glycosyltransferase [Aquisalimonas lutea]